MRGNVNRSKLFTGASLALLITVGSAGGAFLVEQTLINEARQALAETEVEAEVSFSGRHATVLAEEAQLDKAIAVLADMGLVGSISSRNAPSQEPTAESTGAAMGEAVTTPPTPVESQVPTPTATPSAAVPAAPIPSPVATADPMPQLAIQFAGGLAEISPEQSQKIAAMAAWLKANPTAKVGVVGHTDNGGTSAFRVELAGKRARNVVDALVSAGADREQLVTVTKADAEPVAPNSSAEGRAENRRVTFTPRAER